MKKNVTVMVETIWMGSLEGSLQDIATMISEMMQQHGPAATIRYNPNFYYDYDSSPSPRYEVYIEREETDDEYQSRIAADIAARQHASERDRREFERLQKLFGNQLAHND